MKKIITLILGLCLCFALMGCGGSGSDTSNSSLEGESNAAAYYENGNLIVPLSLIRKEDQDYKKVM